MQEKKKRTSNEKVSLQTLIGVCKRGEIDSVKYWISRNEHQLNEITENNENPLLSAVLNRHFDTVDLLIENGADVNIIIDQQTLLGWCFMRNDFKMALYLISKGCEFDITNKEQKSSLLGSLESSFYSKELRIFLRKYELTLANLIK